MSRWRLSGVNWEGRRWEVSDPIEVLAEQLEQRWPAGHKADGTVASQAHDQTSPNSDHRPDPHTGPGIVRAIDIGGPEATVLGEELRAGHDARLAYYIHKGRKFNGARGPAPWEWRPYRGANPHNDHGHLSILEGADHDGNEWNLGGDDVPLSEEDAAKVAQAVWSFGGLQGGPTTQVALSRASTNSQAAYQFLATGKVWSTANIEQLADAIADDLGPELAGELADELGKRLSNG